MLTRTEIGRMLPADDIKKSHLFFLSLCRFQERHHFQVKSRSVADVLQNPRVDTGKKTCSDDGMPEHMSVVTHHPRFFYLQIVALKFLSAQK